MKEANENKTSRLTMAVKEFCQDMMIAEWLAVFYPRKFCVGQVIDLTKNNDLTIEFLDRCPGEVFVD